MSGILANIILVIILTGCVGGAILYIRREKKKGVKCIGCPQAGTCSGGCGTIELEKLRKEYEAMNKEK